MNTDDIPACPCRSVSVRGRCSSLRRVVVIGAGLAGCEAALQAARRGVPVRLYEMRPAKQTEAHRTGDVAELVCSNSLKSDEPYNAHGLLKAELRLLGSALLECAERARVPGGKALVVDRRRFSAEVQAELDRAGVEVVHQEVSEVPVILSEERSDESKNLSVAAGSESNETPPLTAFGRGDVGKGQTPSPLMGAARAVSEGEGGGAVTVVATGPLTSAALADDLARLLGANRLFFYDAIAPIVSGESTATDVVFAASRYGAGADYLNCPMTEDEYGRFVDALLGAELHPMHQFEQAAGHNPIPFEELGLCPKAPFGAALGRSTAGPLDRSPVFFEACLPVEEMARRGRMVLAYGPMKPVGISDPRTGNRPFAVVQLRRENAEGTMYNLVGFQTRLTHGEQARVFRMIPGLQKAEFLRFGSMHRNTYLDGPRVLLPTLQTRARADLFVAGQLTGVEGYVESIGAGLVAGVNAARLANGQEPVTLPRETMMGSLLAYVAGVALGHNPIRNCAGAQQADRNGLCPAPESERPAATDVASSVSLSPLRERVGVRGKPSDPDLGALGFQPMNANFGLLPKLDVKARGRDKKRLMAERAIAAVRAWVGQ